MKVLIAEDERITRHMLQDQLEKWGHQVTSAADGSEAWEKFQGDDFSIVVSDWMMPGLDGLELVRRVSRAADSSRYVYILLLTAKSRKKDIVAGMDAGADDFLSKPSTRMNCGSVCGRANGSSNWNVAWRNATGCCSKSTRP